jgi:cell division transport system ATP-binding protein
MATGITVALEAADIAADGHVLLRDVSLVLRPETLTVISGPGGSGKSHLLRVLWGALPLRCGTLTGEDRDLTQASARRWAEWRRRLGIFCDEFPLGEQWTVFDNVAAALYAAEQLPAEAITRRTAGELRRWDLLALRSRPASALSRSERVRLGLARAFVRGPAAALLDDPLAGLPREEAESLLEAVRVKARAGSAVCLTTDEEWVAQLADVVYAIEQGCLKLVCDLQPMPSEY